MLSLRLHGAKRTVDARLGRLSTMRGQPEIPILTLVPHRLQMCCHVRNCLVSRGEDLDGTAGYQTK